MIPWRFADYLKEVLALTAAVYETPSFGYSEGLANSIFPPVHIALHIAHHSNNNFVDLIKRIL